MLDIKLTYPVSRFTDNDDDKAETTDLTKLVQRFVEVHRDYVEKTQTLDQKLSNYRHSAAERLLKKQAHEAFLEAVFMYVKQRSLNNRM